VGHRIKVVEHMRFFIDEQRFGPYKFWYHQHLIARHGSKTIMEDIVHYSLPFGFFGRIIHFLFVKNKLEKIFNYRFQYLGKKFNR